MAQGHSRYGGSKADIWMNCAGSVALAARVPPKPSSAYAAEGTCAHALASRCLEKGERTSFPYRSAPFVYEDHGETKTVLELPYDMCQAVDAYLNAVWAEVDAHPDAVLLVEQRFVLDVTTADKDEVFGSNDAMVYSPSAKALKVFDYKHGAGVSVTAEDNAQLQFYAAGALLSNPDWHVDKLELVIVQPRARDVDDMGAVRPWPIDLVDLIEFVGKVEAAIAASKKVHFEENRDPRSTVGLVTGSHCRWCDAAAVCPAREEEVLKAMELDFADITEVSAAALDEPKHMDVAYIGRVLKAGKLLNGWLSQVEEYAEAMLMSGQPIDGWKVVEKIGRAKWVACDEDVADYAGMMFGVDEDAIRPRKLTTIGDAEKLLKLAGATKDDIDDFKLRFTLKESSGLTMAPDSDRRPAVNAVAADFGSVNVDGLKD